MADYAFGASQFTTWPNTFGQDVELYARCGLDTIEVTEFKLDGDRIAESFAAIEAAGLRVSSVQTTVHSLYPDGLVGQPTGWKDRARHIRTSMEKIAPHVPPGTPFVAITGAAPGGDVAGAVETARGAFAELAKAAAAAGVRLAFEPLNPMLMNSDTAIWSLGDALELVERVDDPAFGLCLDAWNVWQSPRLTETIARAGDRIFLVQVSDYRVPRSHDDRISIGDGCIPLPEIVRAAREAGYDGPYVLEIFSGESLPDSIWRADFASVLRANRSAFADVWKRSER